MLRILNILAICALMGSAVYAYSTKYQTSFRAEQIAKTKLEIKAERDAIAVLRADWAYMTRPERLQPLAEKYLPEFGPLQVTQLVTLQSLPQKTRTDSIGAKLSEIGLSAAATPPAAPAAPTTTPKAGAAKAKSATPKVAATAKAPTASQQGPSQEPKKP
jgi:cell division protein FtsL